MVDKRYYVIEYYEESTHLRGTYTFIGYVCGTYKIDKIPYIGVRKLEENWGLEDIIVYTSENYALKYKKKLENMLLENNPYVENPLFKVVPITQEQYDEIKQGIKPKSSKKSNKYRYTGVSVDVLKVYLEEYKIEYDKACEIDKDMYVVGKLRGKIDLLEELIKLIEGE